jgi:OmpA-OmpF porin, OOP family
MPTDPGRDSNASRFTGVKRTTTVEEWEGTGAWLPWVIAMILGTLLLAAVAVGLSHRSVESRLGERTSAALQGAGISGATVTYNGRDLTLNGVPESQWASAREAARGVVGNRVVHFAPVQAADAAPEATADPTPSPSPSPSPSPAATAAELQAKIDALLKGTKIEFAEGSASLTSKSRTVVVAIAGAIRQFPQFPILVGGHTDSQGSPATSLPLSRSRAATVRSLLIGSGVPQARIQARGFGQSKPIATNGTPLGRATNRRVNITVLPGGTS